ncbi:hypothetical protein [Micromonospora sp. KC606]|uniref:hypothetical protein n=1 Tax=Micromonospora sp. KC606 TaxID=2530379 RepID=UPI00104590F6|nr:hypothetical protein [Micromonospora sp. KC606]
MTKIAAMAALGLIVGLIAGVSLLDNGRGVTTAQIVTTVGGTPIGGLTGSSMKICRHRSRSRIR